jgi:hypothetical protein
MSDISGEIGLARPARVAAAEKNGMVLGDEGPGDRLVEPACGQRTACLVRGGSDPVSEPSGDTAQPWQRRDGTRSRPTMRTTSSTRSALPSMSGRQLGAATLTVSPDPEIQKPRAFSVDIGLSWCEVDAGQPFDLGIGEVDDVGAVGMSPAEWSDGFPSAQVQHHAGGIFQPRHHVVRIDAALEAVAGVGIDAELPAGGRDAVFVPKADSIRTLTVSSVQPEARRPGCRRGSQRRCRRRSRRLSRRLRSSCR